MKKMTLAAIIALSLFAGTLTAEAQFLKKLGDALDKAANALGKKSDDALGRQLGKTISIGSMTMAAYGDNPGVGFNFGRCYRQGDKVVLTFQYPNQGNRDVENVWIRNYDDDATTVAGRDGRQYQIVGIALGERESSEGVTVTVPRGGAADGSLVISGVPESETVLGRVVFRSTGQYPMDAVLHRYAFVLDNVTIEPQAQAATAADAAMPAGGWKLTAAGVGPVKIGASVSSLPASVAGLYSRARIDGGSIYFELDGADVMYAETSGGRITGLQVSGRNVGLEVGNRTFRVGDDADALKAQPGVSGNSYNDDAEYRGVRVAGHDGEIQTFAVGKL